MVGKETHLRDLVKRVIDPPRVPDEVLKKILEGVRDVFGFEAGIIYIPDYTNRRLRGCSFIGCEGCDLDDDEFIYGFDERAPLRRCFMRNDHITATLPYKTKTSTIVS